MSAKFVSIWDLYILCVISLIRAVNWFSLPKLKEFVIKSVAFSAYHYSRNKRLLIGKNISQAYDGTLNEEQKQKIVKGAFYEFWHDIFCLSPSVADKAAPKWAELRGIEHLHRALKAGKGAILWESNSFGRRTLAKQILNENGFLIYQAHGANHFRAFLNDGNSSTWIRNHVINAFLEKCEKQFVADIVYLPASSDSLAFTRELLNLLRQNAILVIPGDGKSGQKLIPIKFLGSAAPFSTGIISLAKISGAAILPTFCIGERGGRTSLIIEPPIPVETGADRGGRLENSVARYVNLLESYIKKYPEQYRNWSSPGEQSIRSGLINTTPQPPPY